MNVNSYVRVCTSLTKRWTIKRFSGGPKSQLFLFSNTISESQCILYQMIIVILRIHFCEHPVITNSHVLWVLCL